MSIVSIATGAGRGMGLACAQRLAATSDVLVAVDRDEVALGEVVPSLAESGASIVPVTLDVTDAAALGALADQVRGLGTLGGVAHAAGISPTMADWRAVMNVDLVGSALLVDALTPLVTRGTAMVCFASMAAHLMASMADPATDAVLDDPLAPDFLDRLRAAAGESIEDPGIAYGQAKRGVQRLVRRSALAWGPEGGRINSMSPGLIDTPMGRQEFEQQPAMAMMLEHTPLRREGTSEELAAVVAFLCSPEASYVSGTDVLVDGGAVAALER
jgi:NAD(P)-dependent dehydrogenase (short-subunit alcohol dehydrogenase family)